MLPTNCIIPFDSTNALIPAGWNRETNFDGRFPKGASSGFGDTGGSDTHTHTATHSHNIASHSHTVTTGNPIDGGTHSMGTSGGVNEANHTHSGGSTGTPTGTTSSDVMTLTSSSENSLPPYYEVIFIKAVSPSLIPQNGMIFTDATRTGMTLHSASSGKFLRGAGAGADAGGTGGSATHTHSQSHTHTPNTHSHATGTTGTSTGQNAGEDGASSPALAHGHTHSFTVQTSTQNLNSDSTPSNSASSIPYNTSLLHYKAVGGAKVVKVGDIVMTTETTNPIGWNTCDGTNGTPNLVDFYIQSTGSPLDVTGSNTHSHDTPHGHTGNGTHTHTANNPTGYSGAQGGRNGSGKTGRESHRHNITSVSSVTANYDNDNATSTTDSNEPAYIKVKFIQATVSALGGGASFLYNMV